MSDEHFASIATGKIQIPFDMVQLRSQVARVGTLVNECNALVMQAKHDLNDKSVDRTDWTTCSERCEIVRRFVDKIMQLYSHLSFLFTHTLVNFPDDVSKQTKRLHVVITRTIMASIACFTETSNSIDANMDEIANSVAHMNNFSYKHSKLPEASFKSHFTGGSSSSSSTTVQRDSRAFTEELFTRTDRICTASFETACNQWSTCARSIGFFFYSSSPCEWIPSIMGEMPDTKSDTDAMQELLNAFDKSAATAITGKRKWDPLVFAQAPSTYN